MYQELHNVLVSDRPITNVKVQIKSYSVFCLLTVKKMFIEMKLKNINKNLNMLKNEKDNGNKKLNKIRSIKIHQT